VPAAALALALGSAFVHALWNLLLARARDLEAATAIALVVAVVVFAPVAGSLWRVEAGAWPYIVGSAALELAYFILLAAAYGRADLSVVYPISRGVSPILVLVVSAAALGKGSSFGQAAGVCLTAVGILLVRGIRGPAARGVGFGLAIAATIAGYTLLDKEGVRFANPIAYLELVMLVPSAAYVTAIAMRGGAGRLRAELRGSSLLAGLATFGAYALGLAALQQASAASVAAVRATSIVIAALLAAAFLREAVGRARFAGAVVVAGGIALLALS